MREWTCGPNEACGPELSGERRGDQAIMIFNAPAYRNGLGLGTYFVLTFSADKSIGLVEYLVGAFERVGVSFEKSTTRPYHVIR